MDSVIYCTTLNRHTAIESIIRDEIRKADIETIEREYRRQLFAEKLLKDILGDEEYRHFVDKGKILVKSKIYHNRIYVIRELGMIDVIDNEILTEKLCINPSEFDYPSQDILVVKKLGLEGAEELILKIANHIPVLLERIRERITAKEFNLEFDPFSDDIRKEFLERVRPSKKFNLEFDPFSDNIRKEFLERIRPSKKFNLEFDPFSEKK